MRENHVRRLIPFAVPAVLVAFAALAATANATDVKGMVRVPEGYIPEPAADARRPYYVEEWNGFLPALPRKLELRRHVAVVLLGPPPANADNHLTVQFRGGGLLPATIVVRPETILRLQNTDDFAHELFAEGLDGFSAEATSSGQERTVRVTQPGHFALRDQQVPHLHGDLHVVAGLAYSATPGADGSFTFPGVAPGQYTLKVFEGAREASSQAINVAEARELVVEPIVLTPPPPAAAH